MRKLLIISIYLLANTVSGFSFNKADIEDFTCSDWVLIEVPCDNDFWLCLDDYETTEEYMADVLKFARHRCD